MKVGKEKYQKNQREKKVKLVFSQCIVLLSRFPVQLF